MHKFVLVGCILALFVISHIQCQDNQLDYDWKTIVRYSEGGWKPLDTAIVATSIKMLTDSIVPNLVPLVSKYRKCIYPGVWRIDTIGLWHEKLVIDCYYEAQCPKWRDTTKYYTHLTAKAIAVEISASKFQIVYISSTEPGNTSFKPSELIRLREYDILLTRSQMSGTGHFFDEANWIWSNRFDGPIVLKLNSEDRDRKVLKDFLPPNHGIWKGGHFDIRTLLFESYTWRDGDGNCCPSGGKYRVEYGIENDSLVLMKAVFDYSDLEERALWQAQRSADSMYLKNPPIIYERDRQ